jgi:MtN3 and saliva related transmembrane protein
MVELLGFAAGALTTLAFVPQVVRTWRTRSAHDLSLGMLVTLTSGVTLWLVYGLAIRSAPIVVANGLTLGLMLTLVVLKLLCR